MTKKQKLNLIKILKCSFKSENPSSYVDSDGEGWGPALGAAAASAKEHNQQVRTLLAVLEKEVKRGS